MSKVEEAVKYMEEIAKDDSHGYDQSSRWGNPDFDCSALVITAYQKAGIPLKKNGGSYTGNMYKACIKSGMTDMTNIIKLSTGEGLKRGDILLTPYKHTAVYCGNKKIVHASSNENKKARGGKQGDQTGKEICIRSYYNYPWTYVLRFIESDDTKSINVIAKEVIAGKWGNGAARKKRLTEAGYDYATVQALVNKLLK